MNQRPIAMGLVLGAVLLTFARAATAAPIVSPSAGPVTGIERAGSIAYLGIPCAAAPVEFGETRRSFWPQLSAAQAADPGVEAKPTSEDCPYLTFGRPRT